MNMDVLVGTILNMLIGTIIEVLPQLFQVVLDLLSQFQQA